MAVTPTNRLPEFITDGGIETHIIFNMGVELPHFSAFPLNDSATGREVIRRYYRDYLPVARAAGRGFLFATDSWRASPDWADRIGYDRALLKQNNVTSVALCAELAEEFTAAGVESAIAAVLGPRRDAWQYRCWHDRGGSLRLSQSASRSIRRHGGNLSARLHSDQYA